MEEASETLEAIDNQDYDGMREELGDLLLQVVFHALLAEENGEFVEKVAYDINEKLIRRHPHVFGDPEDQVSTAEEVIEKWEKIKADEKKSRGIEMDQAKIFKKLPPQLPALLYAADVHKELRKLAYIRWANGVREKLKKNAKLLSEETVREGFLNGVAACRKEGIDPESALRKFASKQVAMLEKELKIEI